MGVIDAKVFDHAIQIERLKGEVEELTAKVGDVDALLELERQKRIELERTVTGLQNDLIRAGKYENDDLEKRLMGVQTLLKRAGEYVGRRGRR
jgi:chromosome segregation ATPase